MVCIKSICKNVVDQIADTIKEEITLLASTELQNLLIPFFIGVMT